MGRRDHACKNQHHHGRPDHQFSPHTGDAYTTSCSRAAISGVPEEGKIDSGTQPVLILGTNTFAEEVADVVSEVPGLEVIGFIENRDRDRAGHRLQSLPILWIDDVEELAPTHLAICGISTTQRTQFIDDVAAREFRFATAVHPTARVSTRSTLGAGTLISVGSIVAAYTSVGRHVIVNRGAIIGHHTRIGNGVTIQGGANIAGLCEIGEGTFVGMGATILDRITIGPHAVVGAGSVVTRDVPPRVQVVGVPARVVKEGVFGK